MSGKARTDSKTLSEAMGQIAILLQTEDGIANAAIAEAANRITELEREIAGFCRETGEDNPVLAMVELKTMKRKLAEANARLDWIRHNCEIHFDQGASTRMIEDIDEIDALILDQWDRDNIDDQIDKKEPK